MQEDAREISHRVARLRELRWCIMLEDGLKKHEPIDLMLDF